MEIETTFIEGLRVIHLNKIEDDRGSFVKTFNKDFFINNALEYNFHESYFSISKRDVIRGMHFQIPPFDHTKLVYLNRGKIIDVVLDIRKNSPTFRKHHSIELSSNNPKLVYIPTGCAHGFLCLEDDTIVTYLQTSVYSKDFDQGILWNSFDMDWKVPNPIISPRDQSFDSFTNYMSFFN